MRKVLLLLLSMVCVLIVRGQTIQLDGSLSKDPEGQALTYRWRLISGPSTVTFSSTTVVKPTVTATWVVGVYKIELQVTDPAGLIGLDTMQITVNQANGAPKSNAGPDQVLTLPATIATIGLPDAPGLTVQWVKVSGPNGGSIERPLESVTRVTGLRKGSYLYRKIVRSPLGLTDSDDVMVTVKGNCFFIWHWLGWC